jgi:dihydroorotate dehydrogenase (fumarate)
MADLSTTYMGVELKSPVIVAACSLSGMIDNIKRLEAAGAGALVIKSLFEEQIQIEKADMEEKLEVGANLFQEAISYYPDMEHAGPAQHLMWVERARKAVSMPLIASINALHPETWVDYAKQLEGTGVNGLELNYYAVQTRLDKSAADIEKELLDVVGQVKENVGIPVSVKLSPHFTSIANIAAQLDKKGADALVLFNRFLQPDIDVDDEDLVNVMELSHPSEMRLPLRWIAILCGRIEADLAGNSGAKTGTDVAKFILAGASVVQVASVLYENGLDYIGQINDDLSAWMTDKGHSSVGDFRGKVSQKDAADPFDFERAQYVELLRQQPPTGIASTKEKQ